MKYFVRYQYGYYRKDTSWNSEGSDYIEEIDSSIISTETEFEDIYEVQNKLKELHSADHSFDIIALNKL